MKNKENFEMPLSEIIGARLQHYSNLSIETLSLAYNSQNLDLIDKYENLIFRLNNLAKEGKLENFLKKEKRKTEEVQNEYKEKGRTGRKPSLTKEAYQDAVKNGLTKEELSQKYSFAPRALGPMTKYYGSLKQSD